MTDDPQIGTAIEGYVAPVVPVSPFDRAVADLNKLPAAQVQLVATYEQNGETSVKLEASLDIGKPGGWDAGGALGWVKDIGVRGIGRLRWRPRK